MATTETEYLFVYGTLMQQYQGNPYSTFMQEYTTFISTAFTGGELYLIENYPGLIEGDSFEFVYGEVYSIQDSRSLFRILDVYEDYDANNIADSLYIRKQVPVFTDVKLPPKTAWTYIYNKPTRLLRRIEGGNFMNFISENDRV